MKPILILVALILPLPSFAAIHVAAQISVADSTDLEATNLNRTLRALGTKGHRDSFGSEIVTLKGDITVTNGADCDNGHSTYLVQLTEMDEQGRTIQTLTLDGAGACTSTSPAQKFSQLMGRWGASTLEGDCGLGHCWQRIETIECTHFDANARTKAFDACNVKMSSGQ